MNIKIVVLVIVLAGFAWFVALPQAKCAGIARDMNASYSFSAARGCEIHAGDLTWLMTPKYLMEYQR
jgi:hypothetical protein